MGLWACELVESNDPVAFGVNSKLPVADASPAVPARPSQAKSGDCRPLGGTVTEEAIDFFPFAFCHHMGPREAIVGCSCTGLFRRSLRRLPRDSRSSVCAPFGKVLAVSVPLTQCAAGEPRMDISGGELRGPDFLRGRLDVAKEPKAQPGGHHDSAGALVCGVTSRSPLGRDDGEQPASSSQRGTADETFREATAG